MSEINVNPQAVINDLLRQITELTGQNAVLRAALNSASEAVEAEAEAALAPDPAPRATGKRKASS